MYKYPKALEMQEGSPAGLKYTACWDSQDVRSILEHLYGPRKAAWLAKRVTAAMVAAVEGEYEEVWLTYSSQPYSAVAEWERVM